MFVLALTPEVAGLDVKKQPSAPETLSFHRWEVGVNVEKCERGLRGDTEWQKCVISYHTTCIRRRGRPVMSITNSEKKLTLKGRTLSLLHLWAQGVFNSCGCLKQ